MQIESLQCYFFHGREILLPLGVEEHEAIIPHLFQGFPPGLALSAPFQCEAMDRSHTYGILCLDESAEVPPPWIRIPLRSVLSALAGLGPEKKAAAELLRAYHIAQWRSGSRFCGHCGGLNGDALDEIARLCPACGRREYPRISPAVIIAIVDNQDRLLLAHNAKFKEGMYSLIAGFVEPGETLEDTVLREIREETGLHVSAVEYIASQSWPFPDSIMIGFKAKAAEGTEISPDGVEILDVQWYTRDSLPDIPSPGSLSRDLIDLWWEKKL